jgi:general secretion pathway protein G
MKQRGYTLIELLAVLAILAILAAMSMPFVQVSAERSRERELKRALWEIRDAIDAYHAARLSGAVPPTDSGAGPSSYPPDLQALTRLQPDARADHRGESLRFLRRVPRDPFADPAVSAEQSWGLRSFASEADHPQPGVDVYDVYSRSPGLALNGVPLAQW